MLHDIIVRNSFDRTPLFASRRDDPVAAALRGVLRGAGDVGAGVLGHARAHPRARHEPAAHAQRRTLRARAHRLAGQAMLQGT